MYFVIRIECEGDWWYLHSDGLRLQNKNTAARYGAAYINTEIKSLKRDCPPTWRFKTEPVE